MEDERREILSQVAAGELSPEEAARRLEELNAEAPPSVATAIARPAGEIRRVQLVRAFGTLEVIGDPSVREAVADGPHVAHREGDTLRIEGDWSDDDEGFRFGHQRVRIKIGGVNVNRLTVRMNPDLPLEIETQAGSVRVRGIRGPIKAEVQAGSTRIEDFRGPLDLSVQAGSVRADGVLDHGDSRIRCEAGNVRLHLQRGSSVRMKAHSSLGKISLDGSDDTWVLGGGRREVVVGGGAATLSLEASMGNVRVSADR